MHLMDSRMRNAPLPVFCRLLDMLKCNQGLFKTEYLIESRNRDSPRCRCTKIHTSWFLLMNQSKRLTELSAWIVQLISKWFLTHYYRLTLVTTEKTAIMLRISSHAPMLCAFAATGRRNWVVNFQASTRTSKILFIRASRGASGKEATNRVMKPNWITAKQRWDDMFLHIKTSYSAICE